MSENVIEIVNQDKDGMCTFLLFMLEKGMKDLTPLYVTEKKIVHIKLL
jgi:hypothetical protein